VITFTELTNTGDDRGDSYSPLARPGEYLRDVRDVQVATIRPGSMRGNHYHARRREVILVMYNDAWRFGWDTGEGSAPQQRDFTGRGTVMIELEPNVSHAVRNTGTEVLVLCELRNEEWDAERPDSYRRPVLD